MRAGALGRPCFTSASRQPILPLRVRWYCLARKADNREDRMAVCVTSERIGGSAGVARRLRPHRFLSAGDCRGRKPRRAPLIRGRIGTRFPASIGWADILYRAACSPSKAGRSVPTREPARAEAAAWTRLSPRWQRGCRGLDRPQAMAMRCREGLGTCPETPVVLRLATTNPLVTRNGASAC